MTIERTPGLHPSGAWSDIDATGDAAAFIDYLDEVGGHETVHGAKLDAAAALDLAPGCSVLDVGCGAGDDLERFAELVRPGGRAVGVDTSTLMLDEARARVRPDVELHHGDVRDLPFPDRTFDAVHVERVLEHVPNPTAAVVELRRVLRAGGRLCVTEPDHTFQVFDLPELGLRPRRLIERWMQRFNDGSVRNPVIGRELFGLLHRAGLIDVTLEPVLTVITGDEAVEIVAAALDAASAHGLGKVLGNDASAVARSVIRARTGGDAAVINLMVRATASARA